MDCRFVTTTRPYCGCAGRMLLEVMHGRLIGTIPPKFAPMNQGRLCITGRDAQEFVSGPERPTTPLFHRNGNPEESSRDDLLEFTVSRPDGLKSDGEGDGVGFLASIRCPTRTITINNSLAAEARTCRLQIN
jgi:formate dehydrogenase (coenzyme F420) alpha subunit